MKAWILGGTTEGVALVKSGVPCVYTAATEYGAKLAREAGAADARAARLDLGAMRALIRGEEIACVLDATHPYALEATENAARAAKECDIPYLRVLRDETGESAEAVSFETAAKAAEWLEGRQGNILLTTGSKELEAFASARLLPRITARVLPASDVIQKCEALGLSPAQIVAMQGPFSQALNEAIIKHTNAKFLVTKESGAAGGVLEKRAAARALGVTLVSIARKKENGASVGEAVEWARAILTEDERA